MSARLPVYIRPIQSPPLACCHPTPSPPPSSTAHLSPHSSHPVPFPHTSRPRGVLDIIDCEVDLKHSFLGRNLIARISTTWLGWPTINDAAKARAIDGGSLEVPCVGPITSRTTGSRLEGNYFLC